MYITQFSSQSLNLLPVSNLMCIVPLVTILIPTLGTNLSYQSSSSESNLTQIVLENSAFFEENTTYSPFEQNSVIRIPKCCPQGQVLDYGGASDTYHPPICQDSGENEWSPIGILLQSQSRKTPNLTVFHKILNCSPETRLYSIHTNAFHTEVDDADSFHIFSNGTIHSETGLIFSSEHCLDGLQNFMGSGTNDPIPTKYSGNHDKHVVLGACFPQEAIILDSESEQNRDGIHLLIYWVILPFASLFLVATILIYILVWETLNIHGFTLFSYVLSLFGNYAILFLSQIDLVDYDTPICAFIGICTHFFFLMTAAWLTVVNFDVWHTFKHLKAGRPKKNLSRYMAYFTFAVGAPFLLVFVSGVVDNFFKNDPNAVIILPNYRHTCTLSYQAVVFYLYIPLAFLVTANLSFFIYTIFLLLSYQRSIGAVLKGTCTTKEDQSLRLFLKLFVVMGFSWTFEVIGWGIKRSLEDSVIGISTIVAIVDAINLLLAIPIFFIFVWKKSIFDYLWITYPNFIRKPLSLLVFCGCVDSPPEDKRPSISASGVTMSTLQRNGTMTKRGSGPDRGQVQGQSQGRVSTGSVSELLAHRNRKRSNDSQGESRRKLSQKKESANSEGVENGGMVLEEVTNLESEGQEISHNPNDTETCPKI